MDTSARLNEVTFTAPAGATRGQAIGDVAVTLRYGKDAPDGLRNRTRVPANSAASSSAGEANNQSVGAVFLP
ncbi:hypothetical protein JOF53_000829 [Crossiella equi]|uniref:Uncharacterized protein n=1 Tax=Crossiella equi TaxID=130796 RepID=A0ABS5A6S0_9PSEU|nr:hypothetical protein [Crossiella equi]MBP2471957.1 hypothetical protein [Crossiella equi]